MEITNQIKCEVIHGLIKSCEDEIEDYNEKSLALYNNETPTLTIFSSKEEVGELYAKWRKDLQGPLKWLKAEIEKIER